MLDWLVTVFQMIGDLGGDPWKREEQLERGRQEAGEGGVREQQGADEQVGLELSQSS